MSSYLIPNGPMPTTAAQVALATGTLIKTHVQVKPADGVMLQILEWAVSYKGEVVATPGTVELIETDVAATVTAHAASGCSKFSNPDAPDFDTSIGVLGTSATGFNASNEQSITAIRMLDMQLIAPTNQFVKQFPLGERPVINHGLFARIRLHFDVDVNAYAYMIVAPM